MSVSTSSSTSTEIVPSTSYMEFVYAPDTAKIIDTKSSLSLFVAGGISNCPDWQYDFCTQLSTLSTSSPHHPTILYNPRRPGGYQDVDAEQQITWEHQYLESCDAILFWFPSATLCPITLYELGCWSKSSKPIFIGIEPGYARIKDIQIQTKLVRGNSVTIVYDIKDLVEQVWQWIQQQKVTKTN